MSKKEFWLIFLLFLGTTFLFFNPFFRSGFLPFPGDLLVSHYAPWNTFSFLGYAPGGIPHKAQGIDVVRQLFPWKYFSVQMLKRGQLPLWNPYNFSGNPHLANFQTGVFYPLNILFLIFNINLAWSIFILLQPLLACFFTWLFLRELKVSSIAAFLGSLAFAYSLYFTVWLEYGNIDHALLWLPLALFLVEKIIKNFSPNWLLLFLFTLTFSVLAGHIQTAIYLYGVVYSYFFFRLFVTEEKQGKWRKLFVILGIGIFSFFLCAIQIFPTWEIFQLSAREAYPPEKISQLLLPSFGLITAFVPDFFGNPASRNYWLAGTYIERVLYVGVIPLFLALLAIAFCRKEKVVSFFTILALIVFTSAFNWPPALWFHRLQLPIISTTVPTRILWVFTFCLAVLAGFGTDYFLTVKKSRNLKIAIGAFLSLYLFFWLFILVAPRVFAGSWWIAHLSVSKRNLILPTFFAFSGLILLLVGNWLKKKKEVIVLSIIITVFDLFFYFQKITPFSPPEFVYPQTEVMNYLKENAGINRFWGYGTGYIDTNFSTFLGNFSPEGNDPLFIRRYGELISAAENGKVKTPIPRADVVLPKGYGPDDLRANPFRQHLFNLLGVKYLLHKNDGLKEEWQPDYQTFPPEIYQLVWQKTPWQIYENKQVLPRIFLAGDYIVAQGQKIVDLLMSPDFPLGKKLVLEEPLPSEVKLGEQSGGVAKIIDYQPNRVEIRTSSSQIGLLFFSDNYFPGWRAMVDDQPTKIYRADYTFRAVIVPKGERKVVFSYQPQSFRTGALVSLAAFILSMIFIFSTQKLIYLKKIE